MAGDRRVRIGRGAAGDVITTGDELSPRQREVLELLARGLSNKEIGSVLGISGETVRTHLGEIFARLEVTNRTEAVAAYLAWGARTDRVAEILERPAIAVLPVLASEDDRQAVKTAAGLTRDLVSLFARWCWFPVIAHSSVRDARSLGDTSRALGQVLGARFLVDGTLRSSRSTWRLAACIVDAENGHIVWADTRDFPRAAFFDVQDEVCQTIVAAAYPRLIATVHAKLARGPRSKDLNAWEMAHDAHLHQESRERDGNVRAQAGFTAAIAREPTLVLAHFGLGLVSFDEVLNQWGPPGPATDRIIACAERCMDLAPHMAEGYYLAGRHCQVRGEFDSAAEAHREAIGRNPSFAAAHAVLAQMLLLLGRSNEGLARMKQACRLGPRSFVAGLAVAHFACQEYAEARAAAGRAIAMCPRYPFAHAIAAACAWYMEDAAAALAHARALATIQPAFDPCNFVRTFGASVDAVARFAGALEDIAARS